MILDLETCGGKGIFVGLFVDVSVLRRRGRMNAVRTAVNHRCRARGRTSCSLRDWQCLLSTKKVEEILGLGCAVATPFCSGHGLSWVM